jgi:2-C-methyl-D-erythritol 4-phosphate cytidylyltransferase
MKKYALLVAGGVGTRMKSSIPKQFLPIAGKPVIVHTIEAFHRYDPDIDVILVLPEAHLKGWNEIGKTYDLLDRVTKVTGGETRFQSVRAGLRYMEPDSLVAIHDGVRPLISREVIANSFDTAAGTGSAITSVPLKDSIRKVSEDASEALDRSKYRLIQTPQTFQTWLIRKAYDQEESPVFTDCASVAESYGIKISLINGDYTNLKITGPEDLHLAVALLNIKNGMPDAGN